MSPGYLLLIFALIGVAGAISGHIIRRAVEKRENREDLWLYDNEISEVYREDMKTNDQLYNVLEDDTADSELKERVSRELKNRGIL